MKVRNYLLVGAAGFCMVAPTVSFAQSSQGSPAAGNDHSGPQLEEIVVTAQKRSENLQKVPLSVAAFSGDNLEQRGLTSVLEISNVTPGLQLSLGGGIFAPFLRGIGNSANAVGNESSVAMYVDGVYFTRLPPGFFSLNNIEQIEVLKGPQGTLFGRNSSGGVIQIRTPDPSHTTSVRAHVGYGSFDTLHGDFYGTTGLSDTVAMDLSVTGTWQGKGYGRNVTTGTRVGYQDDFTARTKLLFEPSDDTKFVLSGFYSYTRSSQQGNTYPGTTQGYLSAPFDNKVPQSFYDQDTDLDNFAKAQAWGGSLRIDHEFGFARFTSITAHIFEKEHNLYDIDYGPRPDVRADLYATIEQTTQEFQLTSLSGSRLDWILGLYYYDTVSRYKPLIFQGPALFPGDVLGDNLLNAAAYQSRQRAKSYAAYGQATYEVLPGLKLTGGLRYTMDRLDGGGLLNAISNSVVVFTSPYVSDKNNVNKLTFKAAVGYEFTPDVNAYASFSRGYKTASFTLAPFSPGATKPEVLDAYEVGLKTQLLDRRLRFNIAAFWYDVKNPQVQLLNGASVTNSNAGASRVKGIEADGSLAVTNALTFNFGAAYLDAKYRDYVGAPHGDILFTSPFGSSTPFQSINATGNRLPLATKFSANVGAQYVVHSDIGDWIATADYTYNDGFYWEPDNLLRQGSYGLLNSTLTYKPNDHFSLKLWGKNMLDQKYAAFAASQAGPAGFPYIAAAPRTYGITAWFEF